MARMVRGAAQLLRERGYTGTGFREVIERTGAPRGSIYHHFPGGKAQLAGEAVDYVGGIARQVIDGSLADGDPVGALRAFVELWRADFERSGGRAGCPIVAVAVESHDEAPELLDAADRAFSAWEDAFAAALRRAGVDASAGRAACRPGRLGGGGRNRPQPRPRATRSLCSRSPASSRRRWPRRFPLAEPRPVARCRFRTTHEGGSHELRDDHLRRRGPVATVTLNRPDRLNTIVPPMPDEFEAAIEAATADDEVKVIVVRGAGRSFCAGYDFGGGFHHWDDQLTTDGRWDPGKDFIGAAPSTGRRRSSWRAGGRRSR